MTRKFPCFAGRQFGPPTSTRVTWQSMRGCFLYPCAVGFRVRLPQTKGRSGKGGSGWCVPRHQAKLSLSSPLHQVCNPAFPMPYKVAGSLTYSVTDTEGRSTTACGRKPGWKSGQSVGCAMSTKIRSPFDKTRNMDAAGRRLVTRIVQAIEDYEKALPLAEKPMIKASDLTNRYIESNYPRSYLRAALEKIKGEKVSDSYITRICQFGKTRQILAESGAVPPSTEGTLRPLAVLKKDAEKITEAWEKAAVISDAEGKTRITAKHVTQAVAEVRGMNDPTPSWSQSEALLRTLDIYMGRVKSAGFQEAYKLLLEVRILLQEEL